MTNIADLVRQLQSEIEEQYGVVADLQITAHTTENDIDRDKAEIVANKMSRLFENTHIKHWESDGMHWATVVPPHKERVDIFIFYKEGDSHVS